MEKNLKVLIVDDDRRMVKTICDILRIKGYAAAEAYSVEEALEQIASDVHLDCVLMDIRMPRIDGVEALTMIKRVKPDLPVVLMSAFATDEQVEEAKRRGAFSVMTKPFDVQMVLSFLSMLKKETSILIVDDDQPFCSTLANILQGRGCRVEMEDDPAKVLDRMEGDYKLAVVLDVDLKKADSLAVLKTIRAKYPSKPVILVTGCKAEAAGSIEKGLQIGAYTCLYKPAATEGLFATIKEIRQKKLGAVLGEPFEL